MSTTACTHLNQIREVTPDANGCEDCLKTGDTWVHLRLCLLCGIVLVEQGALSSPVSRRMSSCSLILRIEWGSAEGHLKGFRGSPEFQTFLEAVRPFFNAIREMRHYEVTRLVTGKTVTGFANVEEDYSDKAAGTRVMPWRLEDALAQGTGRKLCAGGSLQAVRHPRWATDYGATAVLCSQGGPDADRCPRSVDRRGWDREALPPRVCILLGKENRWRDRHHSVRPTPPPRVPAAPTALAPRGAVTTPPCGWGWRPRG